MFIFHIQPIFWFPLNSYINKYNILIASKINKKINNNNFFKKLHRFSFIFPVVVSCFHNPHY